MIWYDNARSERFDAARMTIHELRKASGERGSVADQVRRNIEGVLKNAAAMEPLFVY